MGLFRNPFFWRVVGHLLPIDFPPPTAHLPLPRARCARPTPPPLLASERPFRPADPTMPYRYQIRTMARYLQQALLKQRPLPHYQAKALLSRFSLVQHISHLNIRVRNDNEGGGEFKTHTIAVLKPFSTTCSSSQRPLHHGSWCHRLRDICLNAALLLNQGRLTTPLRHHATSSPRHFVTRSLCHYGGHSS
jgi:hypothetical protein